MLVKYTRYTIPTLAFVYFPIRVGQRWDKILYILLTLANFRILPSYDGS